MKPKYMEQLVAKKNSFFLPPIERTEELGGVQLITICFHGFYFKMAKMKTKIYKASVKIPSLASHVIYDLCT